MYIYTNKHEIIPLRLIMPEQDDDKLLFGLKDHDDKSLSGRPISARFQEIRFLYQAAERPARSGTSHNEASERYLFLMSSLRFFLAPCFTRNLLESAEIGREHRERINRGAAEIAEVPGRSSMELDMKHLSVAAVPSL